MLPNDGRRCGSLSLPCSAGFEWLCFEYGFGFGFVSVAFADVALAAADLEVVVFVGAAVGVCGDVVDLGAVGCGAVFVVECCGAVDAGGLALGLCVFEYFA